MEVNVLREALRRISDEYPQARLENFGKHPLAEWVRRDLPTSIGHLFPDHGELKWEASAGKGNWAAAPWIAAFDPVITTSAQHEYYPVYLFDSNLDRVTLSLNQGITDLVKDYGAPGARKVLHGRAHLLRARLKGEYEESFSADPIDLSAPGPGSLLAFYEEGHALGRTYLTTDLPAEDDLVADLRLMLRLYRLVASRGGTADVDTELRDPEQEAETLIEKRRWRRHRQVERSGSLARKAKEEHGYQCQACGFDFEEVYGELGHHYIEAHHLVPISSYEDEQPVRLSPRDDFRVVCANCHRMLHRKDAPGSFEKFRLFVRGRVGP